MFWLFWLSIQTRMSSDSQAHAAPSELLCPDITPGHLEACLNQTTMWMHSSAWVFPSSYFPPS